MGEEEWILDFVVTARRKRLDHEEDQNVGGRIILR
jgi:hypothetical protein